jgi:hypothetical protein
MRSVIEPAKEVWIKDDTRRITIAPMNRELIFQLSHMSAPCAAKKQIEPACAPDSTRAGYGA